jgi:O-antigen/teichoic acid export membrane protein
MLMQLRYSVPIGLTSLLFWIQSEAHHYIVGRQFDPAVYALYAVGCLSIPLVAILNDSVSSVLLPKVNRLHTESRGEEILPLTAHALRKLWAFQIPLYVLLLVTGRDLIAWLFTEQYGPAWPIFAVNLTLVPLTALSTIYDSVIRTYPVHRYFLIRVRLVQAPIALSAVWMATLRYGPIGAISVVVVAAALERTIVGWHLGRKLGLKFVDLAPLGGLRKLTVAAACAGVVTALARQAVPSGEHGMAILMCGALFAAVYVSLGYAWQVFTEGERRAIGAVFAPIALVRGK